MRTIFGLVLIAGIALAGLAVYMTRGYLSTFQAELSSERALRSQSVATEEIYIAIEQIQYGDVLTEEVVKKALWPIESMPEGVLAKKRALPCVLAKGCVHLPLAWMFQQAFPAFCARATVWMSTGPGNYLAAIAQARSRS